MNLKFGYIKQTAKNFLSKYEQESPATYAAAEQAIGGVLILDGFIGIDNPLGGKSRPGVFGSLIGVVIGIVFFFVPTLFIHASGIDKFTATTQGTVVSVNSDSGSSGCSARATYTIDGKSYDQNSSDGSGNLCGMTPGSTVEVHYNPDKPGAWVGDVQSLSLFMDAWNVICAVIILSCLFSFIARLLSILFGWKLLKDGRALAKTLPVGSNLDAMIAQIKDEFTKSVFGSNVSSMLGSVMNAVRPQAGSTPPFSTPSPTASAVTPSSPNREEQNTTDIKVGPMQ